MRPSKIKVRQAILNMVQGHLEGATVWDLCAGTGALGIEALSRGAEKCVFVENSLKVASFLKENCAELERRFLAQNLSAPETLVIVNDVTHLDFASILPIPDLIFMDPPYAEVEKLTEHVLKKLDHEKCKNVIICLESSAKTMLAQINDLCTPHGWQVKKEKTYGESKVFTISTL